jgi:hypothetical protein
MERMQESQAAFNRCSTWARVGMVLVPGPSTQNEATQWAKRAAA